jgi:RNA polymerase sigma-70 factor (ECF subfamily)
MKKQDREEDEQIIRLYEARDEAAIDWTERRYGHLCHAVAYNILDSREDAEECVNDAYLAVWNAIPPQKPTSLGGFLTRITRNLALDRYRAEHRDKRGGGQVPLVLEELAEVVSDEDDVTATYQRQELLGGIRRALMKQSPRNRGIFLDRYLRLDTTAVLARRYGVKEEQVLLILSRTRKKLKADLEKEGYTL